MSGSRFTSGSFEFLVYLGVPAFVAAVAVTALLLFNHTPASDAPAPAESASPTWVSAAPPVTSMKPPSAPRATPPKPPASPSQARAPAVQVSPRRPSEATAQAGLTRGADARAATGESGTLAAPEGTETPAGAGGATVLSQPAWRIFAEPRHGYALEIPASWLEVEAAATGTTFGVTHTTAMFVDPETEARLMITVWDTSPLPRVQDWPTVIEPQMVSVNGRRPVNGMVAGLPALVASTASPDGGRPAYAVFFRRGSTCYRIHFLIGRQAAALGAFRRALVTLHWDDQAGLTFIPPLPDARTAP